MCFVRVLITVLQIFAKAVDALAHIYFVGLQEEFQVSSEALIREMGMSALLPAPEIKKEREVSNARLAQDKADIKGNEALMRRAREVNSYDIRLYAVGKFFFLYCLDFAR